jgi:hypothetical protein
MEESVDWLSRETVLSELGLRQSQLRIDAQILRALRVPGFDSVSNERGFSRSSFGVLVQFRRLVRLKGRSRAIAEINCFMEGLINEREG